MGRADQGSRKGRYVLGELLGRGGMGEVYAGFATGFQGFQKPVAIKRLVDDLAHDATFVERLIAEAKLLVGMQHGNIVSVIDLAREGEDVFLVMEFVDGPSLYQLIQARGHRGLPFGLATYIIQSAAAGLGFAHTRPGGAIIHADISPGNLLLTTSGEVRVADFGIARREGGGEGSIEGKWPYMAPEQVRGESLTPRVDVFGLGIVLYELLTGRHAIPLDVSLAERIDQPLHIRPPRDVNPNVSAGLDRLCMRMLAEQPQERHVTMQELINELVDERYANGWREGASELEIVIAEANATPQRKQAMTAHTSRPLTVLTKSLIGPLVAVDDDAPELGPTSVFTAYEIVVEPQDEPVVPVPVEPLTDGPVEPPTAAERAYEKVAGPGSRDTAPQAPTQSPAPPPAVDPLESQRTTVDGEPFSTTDATSADPPSDVEELAPTSKRNVIDDMPLERPLFTGQMLSNDRTAVDGELPPSSYPQVSRPTPVPRVGSAPIWSTPPPASRIRSGRADRHRITWIVLGVLAVVAAGIVGFLLNRSNDTRDERLAKTRDIDAGVPILMVSDAAVVPLDATTVPIDAAVPPVDAVVESRLDASVVQSPNVSRDAGVVKVTPPPPVRNGVLYVNTDDGSWAKVTLTNEQLDTPGAAFKRKVGTYSVTIVDPQRKVTRTCSVTIGPGKQTLTVSMKSGGCTLR